MSRRIVVTSGEVIVEADLAEEVVKELGIPTLKFNHDKQRFQNEQYDDVPEATLKKAQALYYAKLRERNTEKIVEKLKKNGYKPEVKKEGNTTKIVAIQKVYA